MRQLSTIFIAIFIFFISAIPANSAYKGGVSYSIPIEYKNLSENELKTKAEDYFNRATDIKDGIISEETTNALVLYSVLAHVNPTEIMYPVRLGILYGKINRDRYAKGSFSQAIGLNSSRYEPYFYFGEFYYKRQLYRQALKYYNKALGCQNASSEEINKRISEVKQKLGISEASAKTTKQEEEKTVNSETVYENSDKQNNFGEDDFEREYYGNYNPEKNNNNSYYPEMNNSEQNNFGEDDFEKQYYKNYNSKNSNQNTNYSEMNNSEQNDFGEDDFEKEYYKNHNPQKNNDFERETPNQYNSMNNFYM